MKKKDILCNQPTLPPLKDLNPYLEEIWATKSVTNNGPFHQQLETTLCEYLGVDYISLFSSGTTALLTAIKFLDLTKEVIVLMIGIIQVISMSLLKKNFKTLVQLKSFTKRRRSFSNGAMLYITMVFTLTLLLMVCEKNN